MQSQTLSDITLSPHNTDASPILRRRLNYESERLTTFRYWPSDAQVSPQLLARAGFFYVGDGTDDTVQCFACRARHSQWLMAESVMGVHEVISPNCPFVLEPRHGGSNVSLIDNQVSNENRDVMPRHIDVERSARASSGFHDSDLTNSMTTMDLYPGLADRLRTYTNFPDNSPLTPQQLALAGFVYTGSEDRVQCLECNGQLHRWTENDDPLQVHAQFRPSCPFIQRQARSQQNHDDASSTTNNTDYANPVNTEMIPDGRLNVQFIQGRGEGKDDAGKQCPVLAKSSDSSEVLNEIGVCSSVAFSPYYANYEKRLETFIDWPRSEPTKEMLATAGFFYLGTADRAKCFHCNGGLEHWSDDDTPWIEHAKWFPTCAYVKLCKGDEYIKKCEAMQHKSNKSKQRARTGSTSLIVSERLTSMTPQVEHSQAPQCVVCMDAESAVVLLPCGHLCACLQCAPPLGQCPICRKDVKAFVRAYLP